MRKFGERVREKLAQKQKEGATKRDFDEVMREYEAKRELLKAYQAARKEVDTGTGTPIDRVLGGLESLREPITTFFDTVLVMADDEALKNARLSLLQHVAGLPDGVADLSKLEGF